MKYNKMIAWQARMTLKHIDYKICNVVSILRDKYSVLGHILKEALRNKSLLGDDYDHK